MNKINILVNYVGIGFIEFRGDEYGYRPCIDFRKKLYEGTTVTLVEFHYIDDNDFIGLYELNDDGNITYSLLNSIDIIKSWRAGALAYILQEIEPKDFQNLKEKLM